MDHRVDRAGRTSVRWDLLARHPRQRRHAPLPRPGERTVPEPDQRPDHPPRSAGDLEHRHGLRRLPAFGVCHRGETAPPPAPTNTVPPSVSGSAVAGETLSASTGTWTESPTSYAYQWQDCNSSGEGCSSVSGATASSYKLGRERCRWHGARGRDCDATQAARRRRARLRRPSSSRRSPPAPVNTALPAISGSAVEGQTLSAGSGTWSGSPTSYAYQWRGLQPVGRRLLEHQRGDVLDLQARRGRCRAHDARGGDGHERGRLDAGELGRDGDRSVPPSLRRTPRCRRSAGPRSKARR